MNSFNLIFKVMKIRYFIGLILTMSITSFFSCEKEKIETDTSLLHSFSVVGKNNAYFKATINDDNTVTIKVSPYLDAKEVLKEAKANFFLAKGATVSPDPSIKQDFGKDGGVIYTITAQDGVTKRDVVVTYGVSDHLKDGEGFSYAEIGTSKLFTELGYPGEYNNFGLADSKQYGDLHAIPAYCGDHIVLLSRAYIDAGNTQYGIKTFDKLTLAPSGSLNLGSITPANLKLLTSDYKGKMVGMVVSNNETEFFYWTNIGSAPISMGKVNVNMAPLTDGGSNFQVAGDLTKKAWITAAGPRTTKGEHYRLKVENSKVANTYSKIETGHSNTDCAGFQMISQLTDDDEPSFVVGDTEGTANAANSIKGYVKSFGGATNYVMPGYWQNILQAWWVGTGFSTARYGGRSPFVSALVINGKSYVTVTSGTAWWHAAAVLTGDIQKLAHENLNIVQSVNRGWSYGSYADWYYDEENKEAYLAVWFGRIGLKTYKLTCFE